eukprot:gb/GECG01004768.1/.p1 GENE.gb/GECG01004768.1/~~gb/GECG01004768.1/.p1  ORF type:complete len:1534 (+),score=208.22 gb/GECG01004768.1/:1-4602(+)
MSSSYDDGKHRRWVLDDNNGNNNYDKKESARTPQRRRKQNAFPSTPPSTSSKQPPSTPQNRSVTTTVEEGAPRQNHRTAAPQPPPPPSGSALQEGRGTAYHPPQKLKSAASGGSGKGKWKWLKSTQSDEKQRQSWRQGIQAIREAINRCSPQTRVASDQHEDEEGGIHQEGTRHEQGAEEEEAELEDDCEDQDETRKSHTTEASLNQIRDATKSLLTVRLPSKSISNTDCAEAVMSTCNHTVILPHPDIVHLVFQLWLHIWRSSSEAAYVGAKNLSTAMRFMLDAMKQNKEDTAVCSTALRALGRLIFENGDRFIRYIGPLVPWFEYFLQPKSSDKVFQESLDDPLLPTMVCIGNLFLRVGSRVKPHTSTRLFQICSDIASNAYRNLSQPEPRNVSFNLRALSCSLRAVNHIVPHLPTEGRENVASLMYLLHQGISFGGGFSEAGLQTLTIGNKLDASDSDSVEEPHTHTASDSQDTGSETDSSMCSKGSGLSLRGHEQHQPIRVRIAAMQTITAICRKFPGDIRGYWYLFLPEYQALHPQPVRPSLATPLLFDSSAKVREAAAHAISAMVRVVPFAKWMGQSINYAQIKSSSVASSSLSARIFSSVIEVHKAIRRALQQELRQRHSSLIVSIIAGLSELAATIPYSRFPPEILTDCVPSFSALLKEADSSLVIPSLQCVGNMLSNKDACEALVTLMVPLHALLSGEERLKDNDGFAGSLLDCLLQLCGQETPPIIRSEVLSVIAKASRHYAGAISAAWRSVASLLIESFRDMQPAVRSNALKVIEEMLRSRAADTPSSSARVSRESLRRASHHTTKVQEFELIDYFGRDLLWPWRLADQEPRPAITMLDLVHHLIPRGLKDTNPLVRSSACMCVSYLLPVDWARLLSSPQGVDPTDTTLSLRITREGVTLRDELLGHIRSACYDTATSTKSSACRVFGAYSCFRDWKLFDFVQLAVPPLLHCSKENTLSVRMKAIWALSNLCTTPNQMTDATTTVATSSGLVAPTVNALREQIQRKTPPRNSDSSPRRDGSAKRDKSDNVVDPPLLLSQFVSLGTLRLLVDALSEASQDADKVACAAVRTLGLCVKGLIEHMYPVDAFRVASETEEARSPPRRVTYKQQHHSKKASSSSQDDVSKMLTPPPEIKRSFDIVGSDEKALFTGGGRVPHKSTAESPFLPKKRDEDDDASHTDSTVRDNTNQIIKSAWKAGLVPRSPGGFNLMQGIASDQQDTVSAAPGGASEGNSLTGTEQEEYNDNMWHIDHCNISKAMLTVSSVINSSSASAKTRWNACYSIHVVLPLSQILLNAQNRWKLRFGQKVSSDTNDVPKEVPSEYIVPGPSGKPCPDTTYWTQRALQECSIALIESSNYKVKIASAQAIGSVPSRTILCGALSKTIESFMHILFGESEVQNHSDDEKYVKTLRNTVEYALLHSLWLCRKGDFPSMKDSLERHAEPLFRWLAQQWDECEVKAKEDNTEMSPHRRHPRVDTPRTDEEVHQSSILKSAAVNVTEMFESRFKTIPQELLKEYQQKFKPSS